MTDARDAAPDNTAERVALWRAIHVESDAKPHVLEDLVGLKLAAPDGNWRSRPDMNPQATSRFRASIVARARFIEDLVLAGTPQYVVLGAGLDTFTQRHPGRTYVFEVDRPEPQAWKRERLAALGLPAPTFVPVDFEAGQSWWAELVRAGYRQAEPAVVASTGVSMYLSREAVGETLRQCAALAGRSTFVMSFAVTAGDQAFTAFAPDELLALARAAGFRAAEHVSAAELERRYFAGRTDGLRPSPMQDLLVART